MAMQGDLRRIIYALSDALDLVGVDDVAHGKRVGIMAAECGRRLDLPENEVALLFDLGLLHDIGVSSTRVHKHLVGEFDWEGSQGHADVGHALLAGFPPLAELALPIRYHHTRWDRLPADLDPVAARRANLVLLVDRVDALAAPHYASNSVLQHREAIRDAVRERSGSYFAPALVDAFLDISRSEAFWLLLEPRAIQAYLLDQLTRGTPHLAGGTEIRQLAEIFSRIVDAKSPYTAAHSLGVARVALLLSERMGIGRANRDKLEIAGLLHDLGKLRVPDEILDKPAKLDADERMVINTHSFETFQILRGLAGFEEIAHWAAYHHEEPDGTGYPFHLPGTTLPLEARILRVADIFQAMVQDRPYREGLAAAEALSFMDGLVDRGRLEPGIVAVLAANIDEAMTAARPDRAAMPQ